MSHKVLILCGGRGIIDPATRQRIPKAMIQIGGHPLLWHVMQSFANAGHSDFLLALGEGGDEIRRHFLHQHVADRDVEFNGASGEIRYLTRSTAEHWTVKCIDTGINAQTGSRIARCRRYLEGEAFFTTYSDCLCNVDLQALANAHRADPHRVLTVTGVRPPSRFGTFTVRGSAVDGYSAESRLAGVGGFLNGGFMLVEPALFGHLDVFSECSLEREVFTDLAAARKVGVFAHHGYWQAVDTERDIETVSALYLANQRPWLHPDSPAPDGPPPPVTP